MIDWSDVVVAIPTMLPMRQVSLSALLAQLTVQCPGALIFVSPHVEGEPARVDFPRALAAAVRTTRPWVLQLEDDVVLAPTFGTDALAVGLDEADVVTLFSRSRADLEAMVQGKLLRPLAPSAFSMSQAFLARASLVEGIESFAPGWYAKHPEHNRAADLLFAAYLSSRPERVRVLARVPSLVQHRGLPSTLSGHRGARQSESYRKAFGEVP